jgi:hypothetical protein
MSNWINQVKNTESFTNQSKNVSSISNIAKSLINQFILQEDGAYLLMEDGGKILLEQSVLQNLSYNNVSKS